MSELKEQNVERPIESVSELAERLGFEPVETESGLDQEFKLPIEANGEKGYLVFNVENVYYNPPSELDEEPYQRERYQLGVRLGESSDWEKSFESLKEARTLAEEIEEVGLVSVYQRTVRKSEMREGGYDRLHRLLRDKLSDEGELLNFSTQVLSELASEKRQGEEFIENELIPRINEMFPEAKIVNVYEEEKDIFFWATTDPSTKTQKVARVKVGNGKFNLELGRTILTREGPDRYYYFNEGGRYRHHITPDEKSKEGEAPRNNWKFEEIDTALEKLAEEF